jgi:hypothetical protein
MSVGSSLIYVAIVVMWAGLLIPMWLRRHESETEVRSVDRFSTAMRILSRRSPARADSRYLVTPRRTAPQAEAQAVPRTARRAPEPPRATAPAAAVRRPARTSGRARLIARRRRLLIGLVGLSLLVLVLAAAAVVSWWWWVVTDLAVLAFIAHLRAEAKRSAEMARRRHARGVAPAATTHAAMATAAAEADLAEAGVRVSRARRHDVSAVEVGTVTAEQHPDTWEPTPVPLPTYVTAPVAERPMIDLTRPGQWTDDNVGTAIFDDAEDDQLFDQLAEDDDTLSEIVSRRAVGD